MKKLLHFIALVLIMLPVQMYAATKYGTLGTNLTYKITDDGTFTISGTGEMEDSPNYNYSPWPVTVRSSIRNVIIEDGVTSIGKNAFYDCSGLTSVSIPNSVTSIGHNAFYRCTELTSVTIPNSVTSIGHNAFLGCSSLTDIKVDAANKHYDSRNNCNAIINSSTNELIAGCNNTTIPNSVTRIGNYAFSGCSGLTSVTIPNSVTSIGSSAFSGCSGLTGITIPNSVTSIGNYAFDGCSGLTSVTIPNSVTRIEYDAFSGCSGLTSVTIPNSVTSIGGSAFSGCSGLTSVTIPNSVTNIGGSAFSGCSGLTSVTIPNSVTSIGDYAFCYTNIKEFVLPEGISYVGNYTFFTRSSSKIYAPSGSVTCLALWNEGKNVYDVTTKGLITKPTATVVSRTQTTLTFRINNPGNYKFKIGGNTPSTDGLITVTGLTPEKENSFSLYAKNESSNWYNINSAIGTTEGFNINIRSVGATASSITYSASYKKGDAKVTKQTLIIDGKEMPTLNGKITGLKPNNSYTAKLAIVSNGTTYSKEVTLSTAALSMTTEEPKVVNLGCAALGAKTNVDDDEENVGFEWRRTDWTTSMKSNSATATIYEGMIEGYVRNLFYGTGNIFWKVRPYYIANDGTYYYGDWAEFDPTNTSYFDPTVRTYANITIEGRNVLVKGSIIRGTDAITIKGFRYWKAESAAKSANASAITAAPKYTTVEVETSGQLMEVELDELEYNTTYFYQAFAKTSEGTITGETRTFTTDPLPGDADYDGAITLKDAKIIANAYLGNYKEDLKVMDVDGDGKVTMSDANAIVNICQKNK